LNGSVAIL